MSTTFPLNGMAVADLPRDRDPQRVTALPELTLDRLDTLLADVTSQIAGDDERFNMVMRILVQHLHAFVRESRPTEDEWRMGLEFLIRVGHACTPQRNEFILLSDMTGLTSAVDEVNFPGIANATPSSVEGPFHSPAAPRDNGDWIAHGAERERAAPMFVRGTVRSVDGTPLPGATVDIWQADDAGHYDVQDPAMDPGNLRGLFTTDADGGYWFRSVVPSSYPVPTDGPGGVLLRAMGRHPMRPAHIHYRVEAAGYRSVTTHVFVDGDEYLASDAAFAVKPEIVITPRSIDDVELSTRRGLPVPHQEFHFDIALVPIDSLEPTS